VGDFDKILMGFVEDGYKFQTRTREWGTYHIGTKKKGGLAGGVSRSLGGGLVKSFLGGDKHVYIAQFSGANPDGKAFQAFLGDAEKFAAGLEQGDEIEQVLVVTPTEFDKKSVGFLIDRTKPSISKRLKFKVAGSVSQTSRPVQSNLEQPISVPPQPPVTQEKEPPQLIKPTASHLGPVDVVAVLSKLPNPTEGEAILYVWDGEFEQAGRTTRCILAATQERGVVFRRVDDEYYPMNVEFRWDALTNLEAVAEDEKTALHLNDGKRIHKFIHPDAPMMPTLLYHLRYARQGRKTGFIKERDFDPDLIKKVDPHLMDENYLVAVREAFVVLEERLRRDSFARDAQYGIPLVNFAFGERIADGFKDGELTFGQGSERQGLRDLFGGAFELFRNPTAHHEALPKFGREEALEVLSLVNLLLKLSARGNEEARQRERSPSSKT
jgi:uncharacterized protein (TIGR02391 family)